MREDEFIGCPKQDRLEEIKENKILKLLNSILFKNQVSNNQKDYVKASKLII